MNLDLVIVLREHDNDIVGSRILKQASSPSLSLAPVARSLQATVEEDQRLALCDIVLKANMWNVNVSVLVHLGFCQVRGELTLVEFSKRAEIIVVEFSLIE